VGGRFAGVRIPIPYRETSANDVEVIAGSPKSSDFPLAIPETALVDLGGRHVVCVESMRGMFDAVEVTRGPRCAN